MFFLLLLLLLLFFCFFLHENKNAVYSRISQFKRFTSTTKKEVFFPKINKMDKKCKESKHPQVIS